MKNEIVTTKEECANCRWCCAFTPLDMWEAPEGISLKLNEDGMLQCDWLGEDGCTAKNKPIDCSAWPFRKMAKDGQTYITVCKDCPEVQKLGLDELKNAAERNISPMAEALTLNDYHENYEILIPILGE